MNILIIGGTSGIGLALAKHYLTKGDNVTVCGRDIQKVPTAIYCEQLSMQTLDVTKSQNIIELFSSLTHKKIDVLIYCAGKYFNERRLNLSDEEHAEMVAVNGMGFTDCFTLGAKHMRQQGHGHLVAISSVAGLISSSAPSLYSKLKSDMITKADEHRASLAKDNIDVTVIAPGYINTQKLRELNNGNASNKPFLMEESQAVALIIKAIYRKKALAIFPLQMRILILILNSLPDRWVTFLLEKRA